MFLYRGQLMKKIFSLACQIITLLIFSTLSLQASAGNVFDSKTLNVGDPIPDFVMPATKGGPQRLSEYIGQPVMLIWLNDCDDCSEDLIDWQYFAESRAGDGLKTMFIWQKQKGYKAPWSRLPTLVYENTNKAAWWFESGPAVMFINPNGILDFIATEDIYSGKTQILDELQVWLKERQWLNLEGYK